MTQRKNTKAVKVGKIFIGGDNPVAVQSMTNIHHTQIPALIEQVSALKKAGCSVVRMAVPETAAVKALYEIKNAVDIPLVADIHFDYKLAVESAMAGADKIRINPGNIGDEEKIKKVVSICREKGIPIRIGVNSGSLEKHILARYGHPTAEALAESALYHAAILEKLDFNNIILSVKSSDVNEMIEANKILSERCCYPLHLGVTEAGTERMGIIKSAVGIGALLTNGIGDTIRVSLTADPVKEVDAGYSILRAAGLYKNGIEFVSCPTCGRTRINLIKLANEAEERLGNIDKHIKVAIMGCAVNGPGEAKEADIGIAGGINEAVLFKKGEIIRKIPEDRIIDELIKEIESM